MSHRHFSRDDRVALAALLRSGRNYQEIGTQLGFNPTSVSREVQANGGKKRYAVCTAHTRARKNRLVANQCHRKLGRDPDLTETIKVLLELEWSPEQICGRMRLEQNQRLISGELVVASATTIYSWANPRPMVAILLPRKHSKYHRTRDAAKREQRRQELEVKRNIATRPPEVERRERIGDWEGDTMVGKEKKERFVTNVERKSGYLLASKTKDGTAAEIRKHTEQDFKSIPRRKKLTYTLDNGSEHAEWELTEHHTGMTVYFANPYHSWERGTNENTNGLLRRPFPKGTPLATITDRQLAAKVTLINNRPRKRLGWKTPYEVFHETAIRTVI